MSAEERSFCTKLIDVLRDGIDVDDLAFEQRFADYRTVVYGDWNNDFLRYHFGEDGYWVSVRVYPGIVADYEFSPLFRAQANKLQAHWVASVGADEIDKLHDVMIRSCKAFFGGPDTEKPKKTSGEKAKSHLQLQVEDLVERTPGLSAFLGDHYKLLTARDATIAGTSFHPSSSKLRNGSALTCEHEEDNPYDSEAVAIYDMEHEIVGYLPKDGVIKKTVLKAIAGGAVIKAVVVNDGTDGGTRIKRKKVHIALIETLQHAETHTPNGGAVMSAPYCGICGSTDIIMNETGLFVCSNCGARFTIEAMRKLMSNGGNKSDDNDVKPSLKTSYRYGDAVSDALVDQYEAGLYDLAAASWNRIKDRINELDPWVILLGELSEELNKGIDGTLYLASVYKTFSHACEERITDPLDRCPLYIRALTICTTAPLDIIGRQQASAEAAIAIRDMIKAVDYSTSAKHELKCMDQIRIHALIDIACSISAGYSLTNEEWIIIKHQVEAMNPVRKIPLVDRIYDRVKDMVSSHFVAPAYALPSVDASEEQILEKARSWWIADDYDLALGAYRKLLKSDDTAVSIEAKMAIKFLAEVIDDIDSMIDVININISFVEKSYQDACDDAVILAGAKGSDLLKHLINVASITIGIGSFYLTITRAYIQIKDKDNADKYLAIAKKYHCLTTQSYTVAIQSLSKILDKEPTGIDSNRIACWKLQLDLLENSLGDNGARTECLHKLKQNYIRTLKADSSFQEELDSISAAFDEECSKIDGEITEIEQQINDLVVEIAKLETREISSRILTLESTVKQLESDINSREAQIDKLEAKVVSLETDLSAKQAVYSGLGIFARKKKSEIRVEIDELKSQISHLKVVIDSAIDEMNNRIDSMNSAIDQIAALKVKRSNAAAMIENPVPRIDDDADAIVDQDGELIKQRSKLSVLMKKLESLRKDKGRRKEPAESERELIERKWQSLTSY